MAKTVEAYRDAGGPGVLTGPTDFAMVLCSETNFLAHQIRLALDDARSREHRRALARDEIAEALAGLPAEPGGARAGAGGG